MSSPSALAVIAVTIFLLVAIWFIMAGNRGRLTETRLIMLGIFLTLAALLFDTFATTSFDGQRRVGMPNLAIATGQATGGLVKIGFLLVLAGVVSYLWPNSEQAAPRADREPPHVS